MITDLGYQTGTVWELLAEIFEGFDVYLQKEGVFDLSSFPLLLAETLTNQKMLSISRIPGKTLTTSMPSSIGR